MRRALDSRLGEGVPCVPASRQDTGHVGTSAQRGTGTTTVVGAGWTTTVGCTINGAA